MALNMTEVAGTQMQGAPASGIVEIAEHLRQSSVLIGDGPGGRGGSGVIWETGANKSVIITNAHVVFANSNDLATTLEDAAASNMEKLELSLIRGGKKIHWPVTFQINRPETEVE